MFAAVHCTGGDLLIASSALLAALIAAGSGWPREARAMRRVAALAVALGILYTVFSEWLNIVVRQAWAYSDLMPVVPPFDTGLSPLLQWLVIPSAGLWWAVRPMRHSYGTERATRIVRPSVTRSSSRLLARVVPHGVSKADPVAPHRRAFRSRRRRAVQSSFARRSLSAFVTTDTDDRLIASAASIGDSSQPVSG